MDYIASKYPAEKSCALVDIIDHIGLCSHGVVDHQRLREQQREYKNKHGEDKRWQSWEKLIITGHKTEYNQRDVLKCKELCDETSEALANLTAARLGGQSALKNANDTHLPDSSKCSIDLVKKMISMMQTKGFVWPK